LQTPNYSIEIFEDVGRAVCLALLDIIEKNPVSRLPSSQYKSILVIFESENQYTIEPKERIMHSIRIVATTVD